MQNFQFRRMQSQDRDEIIKMMMDFYSSDAVSTNGNEDIFNSNFDNCIKNNPFLEGYIFQVNNQIIGYAMIAKSFSTEFGKNCCWLEDLYLKSESRGLGIIPQFLSYLEKQYPNYVLKLEVEHENTHAVHVYEKQGFKSFPYFVMYKEV